MNPDRPAGPPAAPPPRGSCLGTMMIATLVMVVVILLSAITMGLFLNVLLGVGVILALAGFHYFVWGWWLGRMIREECESEEDTAKKNEENNR